jgi:hypothetical protein
MAKRPLTEGWCCRSGLAHVYLWNVQSLTATHIQILKSTSRSNRAHEKRCPSSYASIPQCSA